MIKPKKRFGQNFLQDKIIIENIISAINPQKDDAIVEIGPGTGALTFKLLKITCKLDAIELDRDLIDNLRNKSKNLGEIDIHNSDALEFDFNKIYKTQKLRIVGNLPYNISTPIIFHLLNYLDIIQDMHFMLQKEVVDRITAKPGNKQYGRLSIMTQYFLITEKLFDVPPEAFYPAPKVDSSIIRLTPKKVTFPTKNIKNLQLVVTLAFQQRRKTLKNTLKKLITEEQLISLNIDPSVRPEQLSVDDFVRISNSLENPNTENP
ncbi:MAG: 16S rRNA (adenine(1518)-N(6)/adenine(1519)-N(6))-dimethyltransferase RsmA [Gammaproteobacteria bacterium]|nr:16S rRNA (adenine(1518)-N(6)/adenine(1519)-N(6))-dimethyltransferase RsmA [Gammaproteobacteria bacterium]